MFLVSSKKLSNDIYVILIFGGKYMQYVEQFPQIKYSDDEAEAEKEKARFENFLELKGVERHKKLESSIQPFVKEISCEVLSHHYRYDVKLRRELFVCFSLLEISLRAFINNHFLIPDLTESTFESQINAHISADEKRIHLNQLDKQKNKITFRGHKVLSLFEYLEKCDMGQLNKIVLVMSDKDISSLFACKSHIKANLDAARELRNLVFHHSLLIGAPLLNVYINEERKNDLLSNVQNVINLIPERARENIKLRINNCLFIDETLSDKTSSNEYKLCPEFRIELK